MARAAARPLGRLRLVAVLAVLLCAPPVAAGSGRTWFESSRVISQGIRAAFVDLVDWILCWFGCSTWSGRPCRPYAPRNSGDGLGCKDEQKEGTLDKFCGFDFTDKVFYCPCCADHLLNDLPRRAALLVPGEVSEATAWVRAARGNECRQGRIRTWSLGGGKLPIAWCDRQRLVCSCGNEAQDWNDVVEPGCRPGQPCAPPVPPEEAHAALSSPIAVGDRVRALVNIEYAPLGKGSMTREDPCQQAKEAARGAGIVVPAGSLGSVVTLQPSIGVNWDDFDQLNNAVVFRYQIVKLAEDDEPVKGGKRLPSCVAAPPKRTSIGEARCQDMSVDQCAASYGRASKKVWNYCEVDPYATRICRGNVVAPADAKEYSKKWLKWSIQYAYNPGLDWEIAFNDRRTFRVNDTDPATPAKIQQLLTNKPEAKKDKISKLTQLLQ